VQLFDLSDQEAGQKAGTVSFYTDFVMIGMAPLSGFLMDIWQRKGVTVIGYAGLGAIVIVMSLCKNIYP